ncbi:hypothetical protein D3C75_1091690 [compost metagenome]
MLAQETHRLFDTAGGRQFIVHNLAGKQHDVAAAIICQCDTQQCQAKGLGALFIKAAH